MPWLWPSACLSAVPHGPAWCAALRPVRSLSVLQSASSAPWCLSPPRGLAHPALLGGCAGHAEAGREPGSLYLPLAPAKAGALGSLRVVPVRGPRRRCPWRVPPASVLGCVRCGGRRVWGRSLTRPASRTVCRSTGDWAGAAGLFRVDADTSVCGSEDATPGSRACVHVLVRPGRVGRAGLPGTFWCASPFHLASLSFCLAWPPSGWGCPFPGLLFALPHPLCLFFSPSLFSARPLCLSLSLVSGPGCSRPWRCVLFVLLAPCGLSPRLCVSPGLGCPPVVAAPPPSFCVSRFLFPLLGALRFVVYFFLLLSAPPLSLAFSGFRPQVPSAFALCLFFTSGLSALCARTPVLRLQLGCWLLPGGCCAPPPCPPLCLAVFVASTWCPFFLFFFSLPLCAPVVFGFLRFLTPGALGLGAVFCLYCGPPAARLSMRSRLVSVSCLAVGCSLVVAAPPLLCLAIFVAAAWCCGPCTVLCCVSLGVVLRRAAARCAARCCAVVCCVHLFRSGGVAACCAVPPGAARRPGALCFAALCFAAFPRALCSVLCVFCRGVVVCAVVRRSALCCVCTGVLCCAFSVLSALCGAVPCCAGVLALCCSCGACCCRRLVLWCAAVCCAVSFGVVLGLVARGCLLVACFGVVFPTKGQPERGGGRAKQKDKAARGRGGMHQNAPGRPASPIRPGRTSTCTHARDRGGASSDPQWVVSASKRNSPRAQAESLSNDRGYRKTDASVTGSTHANHRSARSPRPTPERPAKGNQIAGPRTHTTRSAPSAPASAGASGRHNEPASQPASACLAQRPSKAGGASPRGGERHHGVAKPHRSTDSGQTGGCAAHHAGPRGTPDRHAAGHNQGTRTGPKQQRPPGAANPESAHNTQRTKARGQVPRYTSRRPDGGVRARQRTGPLSATEQPPSGWTSVRPECNQPLPATNSRRPDVRVRARRIPSHCLLRIAAVRMDECAPRSDAPHMPPTAQHTERAHRGTGAERPRSPHSTPGEHTGDQELSGPGHRTRNTTEREGTPVKRSQEARTPHPQHKTHCGYTGEQEPSVPEHRTRKTTHQAGTLVNRSQVAQDTAHATQHTERAQR